MDNNDTPMTPTKTKRSCYAIFCMVGLFLFSALNGYGIDLISVDGINNQDASLVLDPLKFQSPTLMLDISKKYDCSASNSYRHISSKYRSHQKGIQSSVASVNAIPMASKTLPKEPLAIPVNTDLQSIKTVNPTAYAINVAKWPDGCNFKIWGNPYVYTTPEQKRYHENDLQFSDKQYDYES